MIPFHKPINEFHLSGSCAAMCMIFPLLPHCSIIGSSIGILFTIDFMFVGGTSPCPYTLLRGIFPILLSTVYPCSIVL